MAKLGKLFVVSRHAKLPRLRHHFTSGRAIDTPDDATHLLLEAGVVRDWTNARRLVKQTGKTPEELFWELTKKRKADWKRRLQNWLIGLAGGYTFDPHASEYKELERK